MEPERIDWSPSFSVGVKSLDGQHERIVQMINTLISDPGATVRSETISELLDGLTKYANDHFRAEERILEASGSPDLARQQAEHRAYRLRIVELCEATMGRDDAVPAGLLEFMRNWWVGHILETDMRYRPFLKDRDVK